MRRDTWQALRSRVVFVNAPLERSESDSSARIEVSILRKISIGTVQIFQYRYLSKYRYFWQHYNLACFFLNIYMYVCVYVYIKQEVCSQNEQKVLRCVENNTRMFVAEFVCALNNSNRLKKVYQKFCFLFFICKSYKSAECIKNRPESIRFSPCVLQCS